jgi:hypothetical protein
MVQRVLIDVRRLGSHGHASGKAIVQLRCELGLVTRLTAGAQMLIVARDTDTTGHDPGVRL